jgi:hypothetical protein
VKENPDAKIVVCAPDDTPPPSRRVLRERSADDTDDRAQAILFEISTSAYHIEPWASRSRHLFRHGFREKLERVLSPSSDLEKPIATCIAVNTISVYDWLTGISRIDLPIVRRFPCLQSESLERAVNPFTGTLKKQYRMHPSLSRVPRELFYFGRALEDGCPQGTNENRVRLLQVTSDSDREHNADEVRVIRELIAQSPKDKTLLITPYKDQERALGKMLEELGAKHVEACTLDRCQGREAQRVIISLVRSRSTRFMDHPKRWNVALTRARERLVIVGDVDAFLREARRAGGKRPVSLLARIVSSYAETATFEVAS